jgi:hypothetical protein
MRSDSTLPVDRFASAGSVADYRAQVARIENRPAEATRKANSWSFARRGN